MDVIAFTDFFDRLVSATDIATQTDLAQVLGVHRSAVTQAKTRDAVPQKWVLQLSRKLSLSADWLEFGTGTPKTEIEGRARLKSVSGTKNRLVSRDARRCEECKETREAAASKSEIIFIPKVAARLCAGGGSFEVEAQPLATHPFPRWWLAKLGRPADMVFMDVVGDSMEPSICDGDTVLVDQSYTRIDSHAVLAVRVDDAIYLKRVERCGDGIMLLSDNPVYSPVEVFGDELENFHIIGRVVWLCRDCR